METLPGEDLLGLHEDFGATKTELLFLSMQFPIRFHTYPERLFIFLNWRSILREILQFVKGFSFQAGFFQNELL